MNASIYQRLNPNSSSSFWNTDFQVSSSETDLPLGTLIWLHLIVLHRSSHCGHQNKGPGSSAPNLRSFWWLNASLLYIHISCSTLYLLVHMESVCSCLSTMIFHPIKDINFFSTCLIMILCLVIYWDLLLRQVTTI